MASAGTGKTWLLVSRLLRLLLAGARADGILAITFTRKAAAEMHSRLAERLLQLAAADDEQLSELLRELDVIPDAATMAHARRLYESLLQQRQSVRTTTFHAFCQEMLLRFPLEADIPPGFELLEDAGELNDAAWQAMLAEAGGAPDGVLADTLQQLLDSCGGLHGLKTALQAFVAHRGDWWAYTEDATNPVDDASSRLQQQLGIRDDSDPLLDFFTAEREQELAEFAELLRQHPIKTHLTALEQLALARHPDLPLPDRFAVCQAAFLTKSGDALARKASKTLNKQLGDGGEARFLALHQDTAAALIATQDGLNAQHNLQTNRAWYLAGHHLLEHYQRLKREQRLLDFADLEWQAYQLLNRSEHAHWVQYKLDQRIDHLLVDEFQDTNPTQWRLLLPLLEEMAAGHSDSARTVFLVGDAKQSIYRFRRAEPRLFQVAHQWLSEHLQARGFPLHTSWRSSPAIMQCVNQVFDEQGPLQGLLRDFSPHQTHHLELPGQVTVLPLIQPQQEQEPIDLPTGLRNPLERPRLLAQDDRYLREGRQIAATILELIHSGQTIGHGRAARPIRFGDIMLLVKKRTHVGAYEQALREADIPYVGAERGTLLDSIEISDMLALLEWLITPFNNLALATILRSPLFACSDEDLIALASLGKGNWYPRLQDLAATTQASGELKRAAELLGAWRPLAGQLPIHDLLDRIHHQGDVLQRYQDATAPHLRGRVVANLTRFIELALDIDSGRYPSLGHFIARLHALRERHNEAPDEAPVSGDQNRVRMMTIHASKGLEAPVVFIADSSNADSSEKAYRVLLDWPPEAERPDTFLLVGKQAQQSTHISDHCTREAEEIRREQANLLYVALTRPRQFLYISGVAAKKEGTAPTGWYPLLRQALDPLGVVPSDEPCILSSGQPQVADSSHHRDDGEPPLPSLDERLTRPLAAIATTREIAPSLSVGHSTGTGSMGQDEDGRQRGLLIHRLLQYMTEQDDEPMDALCRRVAAEFGLNSQSAILTDCHNECRILLEKPELKALFKADNEVEFFNEIPIIYPLDGQTVHGIVDRLRLDANEVWIIDYKSHRVDDTHALAELTTHYQQQMYYYSEGVQRIWPAHKVRTMLLFTHSANLFELSHFAGESTV